MHKRALTLLFNAYSLDSFGFPLIYFSSAANENHVSQSKPVYSLKPPNTPRSSPLLRNISVCLREWILWFLNSPYVCVEVKWTLMEIGRVFLHVGSAWASGRERRSSQMPFPLKPWLKSWKPPTAQQRNEGKMGCCHAARIRPLYCRDDFHMMEKELHPGVVLFRSKESHFLRHNARFGLRKTAFPTSYLEVQ